MCQTAVHKCGWMQRKYIKYIKKIKNKKCFCTCLPSWVWSPHESWGACITDQHPSAQVITNWKVQHLYKNKGILNNRMGRASLIKNIIYDMMMMMIIIIIIIMQSNKITSGLLFETSMFIQSTMTNDPYNYTEFGAPPYLSTLPFFPGVSCISHTSLAPLPFCYFSQETPIICMAQI